MIRLTILLVSCLLLLSCGPQHSKTVKSATRSSDAGASEREKSQIELMNWIDDKDPIADARTKVSQVNSNNCIYLAGSNRNKVYIPGLSISKYQTVVQDKQYQVLEGMGDLIVGDLHKKYRKRTRDYMFQYNKELDRFCN